MSSGKSGKITKRALNRLVYLLVEGLARFNPVVKVARTGTVYIKLTGNTVKEIRISNHKSRRRDENVWQLRPGVSSHIYKSNRVYNAKDIDQMISDVHLFEV